MIKTSIIAASLFFNFSHVNASEKEDIIIADFEGATYGKWEVSGDAVGTVPAKGTLRKQRPVTGFYGQGLVNTFLRSDKTKCVLNSPDFVISRKYIHFRVGGGDLPEKACVNLLIDGKVVYSTTGKNSEILVWETWDVTKFNNKTAQVQIVDKTSERWGHILVDQIYQSSKLRRKGDYMIVADEFTHIYDQSIGEKKQWYINDHCFIKDKNEKWHMFGITHEEPNKARDERNFAHATADSLLQQPWDKQPFALSFDPKSPWKERHLWAPYVVFHDGTYYMYYCAGGKSALEYKIHLATSKDLKTWTRHPKNPMLIDGYDARDPCIIRDNDKWIMYYTANRPAKRGNHVVMAVTSDDLVTWKDKRVVFTHPKIGTTGGPTESPFVVTRKGKFYLFLCTNAPYNDTAVYESDSPFEWDIKNKVGKLPAHAAEVIRVSDDEWYISRAGWGEGGLYLARLRWLD